MQAGQSGRKSGLKSARSSKPDFVAVPGGEFWGSLPISWLVVANSRDPVTWPENALAADVPSVPQGEKNALF
jgi:hypothetical protein